MRGRGHSFRRLSIAAAALVLIVFGIGELLTRTPHGHLTWQTGLILRLNNTFFAGEDWPATDPESLARVRSEMHSVLPMIAQGRPSSVQTRDAKIPGPAGAIPIRIYERRDRADRQPRAAQPLLVYYHGGGHVIGDIRSHDHICAELAARNLIVVSVDYRLAPEHPFPAAVDDSVAAMEWALKQASELGADPARVYVGGDSAGGNLAAAAALVARDRKRKLRGQILVYPVTDTSRLDTESYDKFAEGYLLTRRKVDWFRTQYLPKESMRHEPLASPLRAKQHRGLAPALVVTAEFDVLRDDGFLYAEKLRAAKVPTTYVEVPGVVHGFLSIHRVAPEGLETVQRMADWIAAN